MDNKNMLRDEELEKVSGGFEYEGQEYDSVQLLDMWIDAMNAGDRIKVSTIYAIVLMNREQFTADLDKAGRTIPEILLEVY